MERCPWCLGNEKMIRYHDEEWGVPVHDDQKQFEFLMMEVMQCGLNWNMMIQKREIFRACFDNFDFDKVSAYGEADIERIMGTEGMIRSRRKIEAVIHNTRCFQKIRAEFGSFSDYIWGFTKGKTYLYMGHQKGSIPARNGLSDRISADLKKRGLKYMGSVTVYSHLQACGIINDHWEGCYRYRELVSCADVVRKRREQGELTETSILTKLREPRPSDLDGFGFLTIGKLLCVQNRDRPLHSPWMVERPTVFFYGDHVFIGGKEYLIGQCCVDMMNLNEAVLKKLRVGSRFASLPRPTCSQKRQTAPQPLHRKGWTLSGISYLRCLSTEI